MCYTRSMTLPTLYSRSKSGAIWSWKVWTEGNEVLTEFGLMTGAKQVAKKLCSAKNIGKANSTTDDSQANVEAQSMWTYQRNRRYRESPEEAEERVFLPMLASSKVLKRDDDRRVRFPADLQIKFDGFRAMTYRADDGVHFLSRQGKEFDLPHLKKQLESFLPDGCVLDGELYNHGTPLQTIQSWAKKLQPNSYKLSYRVYDCPEFNGESDVWKVRKGHLERIAKSFPKGGMVHLVQSTKVNSIAEAYGIVENKFVPDGYEGGILRMYHGLYLFSKRSNELLKLKLFEEDDFEVIGFKGGEPGTKEANAVIWRCKIASGYEFDVRPTGSIGDREEMMKVAKKYIGKMYSVKYKGTYESGCPCYPVGIAFKEDR